MAKDFYERKISAEEATEGYILVEKSALGFFPPIGQTFSLVAEGKSASAKVEARDCECRGPAKPHQHYFIRKPGLEKGSRWRIRTDSDGYRLEPIS